MNFSFFSFRYETRRLEFLPHCKTWEAEFWHLIAFADGPLRKLGSLPLGGGGGKVIAWVTGLRGGEKGSLGNLSSILYKIKQTEEMSWGTCRAWGSGY